MGALVVFVSVARTDRRLGSIKKTPAVNARPRTTLSPSPLGSVTPPVGSQAIAATSNAAARRLLTRDTRRRRGRRAHRLGPDDRAARQQILAGLDLHRRIANELDDAGGAVRTRRQ